MIRGPVARSLHGAAIRAAAGGMLSLWLGIFALTACPQLHELLHKDAQNPEHQCLITQIQHHQLLAGSIPVSAPVLSPAELDPIRPVEFQLFPASDYRLSPGRAPPIASLAAAA
jgi:hypothetical protein